MACATYSRIKTQSDFSDGSGDGSESDDSSHSGCTIFDSRDGDSRCSNGPGTEKDFFNRLQRLPKSPLCGSWPQEIIGIVYHYHDSRHGQEPVPMGMICGPALRWTFCNIGWQMVYFLGLMPIGSQFLKCTPNGLGRTPAWWSITLMPVVALSLWFEVQAVPFVLVPMLQVNDRFAIKIPGKKVAVRARVWLAVQLWMSFLSISNTANICAFSTRVMAATQCGREAEANGRVAMGRIWNEVINQSFFLSHFDSVSLQWIGFGFWLLSFSPFVFTLLWSWPVPNSQSVTYDVVVDGNPKGPIQYRTMTGAKVNHGMALSFLSEACGMASVLNCVSLEYAQKKFKMQLASSDPDWVVKCLEHAKGQCVRSVVRTFFGGTLKNALQLNLQITVYACLRASQVIMQEPEGLMPEMLYSIVLGIFSVLLILQDTWATCRFAHGAPDDIKVALASLNKQKRKVASKKAADIQGHTSKLFCLKVWLVFLTVFCCCLFLYAIAKLSMSFVCESAIWNVSGCVDVERIALSTMHPSVLP
mmetsp:Transcript_52541/g.153100  ORF Transcript_52541/g.153100 Transcript_52541/m.153100 type:complete len:530 (+) Transcript_52541:95-1684(+)